MFVDLPLEELGEYRPEVAEPANLDGSWTRSRFRSTR
jgi:cephalosporin-C deacetylase-like acetyl esterase